MTVAVAAAGDRALTPSFDLDGDLDVSRWLAVLLRSGRMTVDWGGACTS